MTDEYKGGTGIPEAETDLSYSNEVSDITGEVSETSDMREYSESPDNETEAYDEYDEFSEYGSVTSADIADEYETETGVSDDVINGLDTIFNSFDTGTPDISNVVLGAVTVASGASAFVMNMRKKLKNKALDYINMAEEEFVNERKAGKSKKMFAVQAMTNSVPALLRPFVSTSFAEKAIDSSFNNMNKFAKLQNSNDTIAHQSKDSETTEDDGLGEERFAPIIDLIKNKGKSIEIGKPEVSLPSTIMPRGTTKISDSGYNEGVDISTESKSPVVVNLYLEQPDGSFVRESRKQEGDKAVNINIGYKCKYSGENNKICRECAFNDNHSEYEAEGKEVYG